MGKGAIHVFAGGVVILLHGMLAVGLLNARREDTGGGAPAILLTLERSPRFDGTDGSVQPAKASDAGAKSAPAPPSPSSARPQQARTPVYKAARSVSTMTPELSPATPPSASVAVAARQSPVSTPAGQNRASGPGQDVETAASADAEAGATSGGGAPRLGARAATDEDRYAAEVVAWIERHKRHPGDGSSGIVSVGITLDRTGRLRQAEVSRSSGSPSVDRLALSQLSSMQPFPRPAPGTRWARREFDVLIDYRLR